MTLHFLKDNGCVARCSARSFLNTLVNLIPQIDSPGLTFGFLLKSHYGI